MTPFGVRREPWVVSRSIEEASAAMIEGSIAGLSAAIATGMHRPDAVPKRDEYIEELRVLRSGPTGQKIRDGLAKMQGGN